MQNDKVKVTTFKEEAHRYAAEAIDIMETAVGSTYGPGGRPMLIKKMYVDPILSTDGVTVARNIAGFGSKLKDPRITDVAKLIYQASEKTNKTAGDGTTATVVVLCEAYKSGYQQIAAGIDAMHIKRKIDDARNKITTYIESKSVECDKEKLTQVATISGKDENLGKMIADLVWDVGSDGAITIEYQNAPHLEVEKVTGYLFGTGFKNLALDVEFAEPIVFVTQKRMAAKNDIVPILEIAAQNQRQFIIVGDVSGAAYETLIWALQNQKADGLCIPPPAYGNDGHEYFEDIATYTGATLWLEANSFKEVTLENFGTVKRSRVSRDKAILFGDNARVVNSKLVDKTQDDLRNAELEVEDIRSQVDSPAQTPATLGEEATLAQVRKEQRDRLNEANTALSIARNNIVKPMTTLDVVTDRIKTIKDEIKKDIGTSRKEVLEQRLAKLAGKVSIIKVGAATEVEREELFFRVEDAVEASKSALSSGVVAGGATTLLFAGEELEIDSFIRDALQEPFRLLMKNAAYRADLKLDQTLKAGYGKGFDLHTMTEEPIDLIDKGVVDATKVVLQTVKNAFSVAGGLLSAGGSITEEEDEKAKTV